ncbi:MAG: ABC transporter ATP-binding protein [Chloroflexi bacterium]|nr:ABC transporter ATP-binding protein [Chloroflexota bacterium]MDA8187298.1 ABC transporter ATP-binding protein [Dehalococcoidales bacterium]
MSLLEVTHLESGYGRIPVLHGIDLAVEEGEMVAVIGPNGAGKSTLMRSIFGLLPRWHGEVQFLGRRVHDYEPSLLPTWGLSYVPQGINVFTALTVAENLEMACHLLKVPGPKIREICQRFPILERRRGQLAGTLSGGERQMLAIASALMLGPKLLMLDEPTTGLAPIVAAEVIQHILDINREGTAILWVVEENPASVLQHCSRVYLLESGQIRRTDSGIGLLNDPHFAELFLGVA